MTVTETDDELNRRDSSIPGFFEAVSAEPQKSEQYPPITYFWTVLLISDHSYLVENLTYSKVAETKALDPSLKS